MSRQEKHRPGPKRMLFVTGLVVSALLTLPLIPSPGTDDWLRRPLADDAYYELSIARSVASGQGPALDGLPTSGFQPLYLLVCLTAGALGGWRPLAVPLAITVINWILWNVAGTLLIARLGRRLHPGTADGWIAMLPPLLWLLNAPGQAICLNGMETSLAVLSWGVVALAVAGADEPDSRSAVLLGCALGGAFLARNDAVVLCAGVAGVSLAMARSRRAGEATGTGRGARFLPVVLGVALLWALPWVLFSARATGSILPQGGRAEGLGGLYDLGRAYQAREVLDGLVRNLILVPFPFGSLPVPARLAALLASFGCVCGVALWVLRNAERRASRVVAVLGVSLLLLAGIYAAMFGAAHMARRWLAPGVLLGVLLAAETGAALHRIRPDWARRFAMALLCAVFLGRCSWAWLEGQRPAPTNTWPILQYLLKHDLPRPIGSFQSGLLSWVEPGIVNLDGKTNRTALEAIAAGRFGSWLAASPIQTVVDANLLGVETDAAIEASFRMRRAGDGVLLLERVRATPVK